MSEFLHSCQFISFQFIFMHSLIHSFIHSFIPSLVHSFNHSLLRSFLPAFLPSFIHDLFLWEPNWEQPWSAKPALFIYFPFLSFISTNHGNKAHMHSESGRKAPRHQAAWHVLHWSLDAHVTLFSHWIYRELKLKKSAKGPLLEEQHGGLSHEIETIKGDHSTFATQFLTPEKWILQETNIRNRTEKINVLQSIW